MEYRQLIIARKDLNMSFGKLASQVAHASNAFMIDLLRKNIVREYKNIIHISDSMKNTPPKAFFNLVQKAIDNDKKYFFYKKLEDGTYVETDEKIYNLRWSNQCWTYGWKNKDVIDRGVYENWLNGIFTKTVCQAKNKNQLMKAVTIAEELGLKEGEDFWLIKDNCLTELEPEEFDENGVGRTLTCIGFRPLPTEIAHQISKKFHLYV